MKRLYTILFCFILFTSCEYFSFKKPTHVAVPKVDSIDFSKVDDFPVFPECDSIPSQEKQRICFQLEMSKHIYHSLNQLDINAKTEFNDTIIVKIIVDNLGKTKLSSIQKTENIAENLPKLDSIIKAGLLELPVLQPAIKRGIPVSAEFSIPIIIKTD